MRYMVMHYQTQDMEDGILPSPEQQAAIGEYMREAAMSGVLLSGEGVASSKQGARVEATNDLEPLADKLAAFNWEVVEVDGHDHGALLDVFANVPAASGKPTAVIAHTMKGHPISFMSDNVAWHHKVPSTDQVTQALTELEQS